MRGLRLYHGLTDQLPARAALLQLRSTLCAILPASQPQGKSQTPERLAPGHSPWSERAAQYASCSATVPSGAGLTSGMIGPQPAAGSRMRRSVISAAHGTPPTAARLRLDHGQQLHSLRQQHCQRQWWRLLRPPMTALPADVHSRGGGGHYRGCHVHTAASALASEQQTKVQVCLAVG